jgi:hypothetical protein
MDNENVVGLGILLIFLGMLVILVVGFIVALIVGLPFMWVFNAVSTHFGGPTISYWIAVLAFYGLQIVGSTVRSF